MKTGANRFCQCVLSFTTICMVGQAGRAEVAMTNRGGGDTDRVAEYAISPNGKELAEVLVAGSRTSGPERVIAVSLGRRGRGVQTTLHSGPTGQIFWESNRSLLMVEVSKTSAIVQKNIVTGQREVLFKSSHPISVAAYDRRRNLLAYEYSTPWTWRGRSSVRVKNDMDTLELLAPPWARWPGRVHVRAIRLTAVDGRRGVQKIGLAMTRFRSSPALVWRNGHLFALISTFHSWRTRLFDLESGRRLARRSGLYRMSGLTVSPRGQMVVVSNRRYLRRQKSISCGCTGSLNLFRLKSRGPAVAVSSAAQGYFLEAVSRIWWARHGRVFAQIMGYREPGGAPRWFLEEVNTTTDHIVHRWYWRHGDLGGNSHNCDFDAARTVAVCVAQTLRNPPVLVRVNLKNGAMRGLGAINPGERRLDFNFVKLRIESRFGHWSTGFLAVPPHARTHAVPLAVMSYDFTESYSRNAQWITSYPVARFVHSGIAVLLMNWAGVGSENLRGFAKSKRALESAVSLYRNAITAVTQEGVTVSRAMVMGWSFGGLFAAHAIQVLPTYVAAQVGDPADYNVTAFGLGGDYWRSQSRIILGGPPTGRYLKNYQYFDPVGNGHAAMGPVLLEFVSRNPDVGQLLEEWRAAGTEVEAFAYRRSVHWLNVPAEARISRLRNLYWARLNLLGPDAVTAQQLRSVGLTIPRHGWWNAQERSKMGPDRAVRMLFNAKSAPRLPLR